MICSKIKASDFHGKFSQIRIFLGYFCKKKSVPRNSFLRLTPIFSRVREMVSQWVMILYRRSEFTDMSLIKCFLENFLTEKVHIMQSASLWVAVLFKIIAKCTTASHASIWIWGLEAYLQIIWLTDRYKIHYQYHMSCYKPLNMVESVPVHRYTRESKLKGRIVHINLNLWAMF